MKKVLFLIVTLFICFALACGKKDDNSNTVVISKPNTAFVLTSDYITGSFSTITLDSTLSVKSDLKSINSDAVVRYFESTIYIIERYGKDNILALDPKNNFSVIKQYSTGNGSNPQDIAFVNKEKAYISRLNDTTILIVNPLTGEKKGEINLSTYADSDGIPEAANMVIANNKLYVAIQCLNQTTYTSDKSYIIVINTSTDTIEKAIQLTGTNPYDMVYFGGKIYISEVGSWGVLDAGIETIDINTDTVSGFIITESSLGGDAGYIDISSSTKGYAVVTNSNFNTILKSFNLATGAVAEIYAPIGGGFVLDDIALTKDNRLLLSDRTKTNPGVRIFNTDTDKETTTNPINVGLPPKNILIME